MESLRVVIFKSTGLEAYISSWEESRWYLLVAIAPRVFSVLAARVVLEMILWPSEWGAPGFFDEGTVSSFSNTAAFVVAILLSGVMEDYKEAESVRPPLYGLPPANLALLTTHLGSTARSPPLLV